MATAERSASVHPPTVATSAARSAAGRLTFATESPAADLGGRDEVVADVANGMTAFQHRWRSIQASFVDDPRGSVAAAADLATEAIDALTASNKERERALRSEWDRDGVDTEGLRITLRSYRSLLNRLPAV